MVDSSTSGQWSINDPSNMSQELRQDRGQEPHDFRMDRTTLEPTVR